ncbi:hypothetical protein DFH07DRAFT_833809 [Mycena maculata]|uniref:F-box domain-containing protein n=1 Tax=Mycena maculata TaxID=230809 RepID=A0AAD7IKD4_9AGAR|nr:hypothetical protein DFH07DRAFT_833809 [Mycena maculata]
MTSSLAADAVRTRIEEISSAIARQKEILRSLEIQKSAAHGELKFNAIRDPMSRLPLEISSEIFAQCLPARPKIHPLQAPTIFLGVCRLWRDIALYAPGRYKRRGYPDTRFRQVLGNLARSNARSAALARPAQNLASTGVR